LLGKLDDPFGYHGHCGIIAAPDVFLAASTPSVTALQHVTRTLPIVFANVADPVGAGFVDSLARPGGNVTGFMALEYGFSGKWLELLKQIAPQVTRAAVIRDPALSFAIGLFGAIQAVAPALGVEVIPIGVHDIGSGALSTWVVCLIVEIPNFRKPLTESDNSGRRWTLLKPPA
jgi:putative tryptophan/tyrosine transport system substrate-binding protein